MLSLAALLKWLKIFRTDEFRMKKNKRRLICLKWPPRSWWGWWAHCFICPKDTREWICRNAMDGWKRALMYFGILWSRSIRYKYLAGISPDSSYNRLHKQINFAQKSRQLYLHKDCASSNRAPFNVNAPMGGSSREALSEDRAASKFRGASGICGNGRRSELVRHNSRRNRNRSRNLASWNSTAKLNLQNWSNSTRTLTAHSLL